MEDIHWWGKFFLTNTEEEMEALMNDAGAPELIREAAMTLKNVNTYEKLKAIIYDKRLEEIVFREEIHLQFMHGLKTGREEMQEAVRKAHEEAQEARAREEEAVRKAHEEANQEIKNFIFKMCFSKFHISYDEMNILFKNLSQDQLEFLLTFSTLEELKEYLARKKIVLR